MELKTTLQFVRSTKNTHRYDETAKVPIIGQLYVQKHAMPEAFEYVEVTITCTNGRLP